jgi:hypothetical protein
MPVLNALRSSPELRRHAPYREIAAIEAELASVACHADRDVFACGEAGDARGRSGERRAAEQARALGYYVQACALEAGRRLAARESSRCSVAALCVLEGRCGARDLALATDLFRLACARGDQGWCEAAVPALARASTVADTGR